MLVPTMSKDMTTQNPPLPALWYARQRCGFSQAELARRARLDQATLSRIESGRTRPYRAQLERLAGALGIRPNTLARMLGHTDSTKPAARSPQVNRRKSNRP